MKIYIEYFMVPASHDGIYDRVLNVSLRTAFRLWLSTGSARQWGSSNDTAGNTLLEKLLVAEDPRYRYPVSAVIFVRPDWWWRAHEAFKDFVKYQVLRRKKSTFDPF